MIQQDIPKWGKILILSSFIATLILLMLPCLTEICLKIKNFIKDIDDNFDDRFGI